MPRTTVDIDAAVLRELRRRQRRERKTLGQLVSELLAQAMAEDPDDTAPFAWTTRSLEARVDLEDKEAVAGLLKAE